MQYDEIYLQAAIAQARKSLQEGGIPIGASLAVGETLVGLGHNRRVQKNDPILHGETDCIRNAGRMSPREYRRATLYTTLSPCDMCTGTILMFGIGRVVIAENSNFVGGEDLLRQRGVEVVVVGNEEIRDVLEKFISENQQLWCEDISRI